MKKNTKPLNLPHTVLIGAGKSVAEFLLMLEKKPFDGRVTVIGENWTDLFFLQSLCSLMKISLEITKSEPADLPGQKGVYFVFSEVLKIDFDRKEIFCREGVLRYDALILVNENRPKALLHQHLKYIKKFTSAHEFESWIREGKTAAVVEGSDFSSLAMAERLSTLGVKTCLVCKNSNLADEFLPNEEACLLAKHLKNKGIGIFFNQQIDTYLIDEPGNITGVRLNDGKEFSCTLVIHTTGFFPEFSYLRETAFYSGEKFFVNHSHQIITVSDSYAIGQNLSHHEKTEDNALVGTSTCSGPGIASFFQDHYNAKRTKYPFVQLEVMGLTWSVYGDFSTKWGSDTQNFYWEHPNGQISFRMHYDLDDLTIKSLATLGIEFKGQFVENAIQHRWEAKELIENLEVGMEYSPASSEIIGLISKAFSVEFKELNKENNPSLIDRILERLF